MRYRNLTRLLARRSGGVAQKSTFTRFLAPFDFRLLQLMSDRTSIGKKKPVARPLPDGRPGACDHARLAVAARKRDIREVHARWGRYVRLDAREPAVRDSQIRYPAPIFSE